MSVACPTCQSPAILTLTHYLTGERSGQEELALRCSAAHHSFDQATLRAMWDGIAPDVHSDSGPRTG